VKPVETGADKETEEALFMFATVWPSAVDNVFALFALWPIRENRRTFRLFVKAEILKAEIMLPRVHS
jgi:hypothetical protein